MHQVYQAVSLKVETETYRRRQQPADPDTGEGLTMGALYWQVLASHNDSDYNDLHNDS